MPPRLVPGLAINRSVDAPICKDRGKLRGLVGLQLQESEPPDWLRSPRLFISEATVKTHLLHIYEKLDVNDRAAAVAAGYERGLLTTRSS